MVKTCIHQWLEKYDNHGGDCIPLSNRRTADYKHVANSIAERGIAISINPRDVVITDKGEQGIKTVVQRAFDRHRAMYLLIPEYNTNRHKLHYHGVCIVKDYETLGKITRSLVRQIGRIETENIKSVKEWVDYMFKSYDTDEELLGKIITIFKEENIIYPKYLHIAEKEKE